MDQTTSHASNAHRISSVFASCEDFAGPHVLSPVCPLSVLTADYKCQAVRNRMTAATQRCIILAFLCLSRAMKQRY